MKRPFLTRNCSKVVAVAALLGAFSATGTGPSVPILCAHGELGVTALHTAARKNDLTTIQRWIKDRKPLDQGLQYPSNCHEVGDKGITALMLAAERGHTEAVNLLLKAGARAELRVDPDSHYPGEDALDHAMRSGNPATIQVLLNYMGAEAISRPSRPRSAYEALDNLCGSSTGSFRIEHPIELNPDDSREAAKVVFDRIISVEEGRKALEGRLRDPSCGNLIHFGLDRGFGATPVMLSRAVCENDLALIRRLAAAQVDMNTPAEVCTQGLRLPLQIAMSLSAEIRTGIRDRDFEAFDLLVRLGADVNARGSEGETLLEEALEKPDVALVNRLVAAGARTDIPGKAGKTAGQFAREKYGTPRTLPYSFSEKARSQLGLPPLQRTHYGRVPGRIGKCANCPIGAE